MEHVRRVRADQESQQDDRNTEETSQGDVASAADEFAEQVAAELATVMPSEMFVAGRQGPGQSEYDPAAQSGTRG